MWVLSSTTGMGVDVVNVNSTESESISRACTTGGAYLSWPSSSTQPFVCVEMGKIFKVL